MYTFFFSAFFSPPFSFSFSDLDFFLFFPLYIYFSSEYLSR